MKNKNIYGSIDKDKHYKRMGTDQVFTGRQLMNLIDLAPVPETFAAIVLRSIQEVDEPATDPKSKCAV